MNRLQLRGVDPELNSGDMAPGDSVKGYVPLEIPSGATAKSVKFTEGFGDGQVIWE